MFENLSSKTNRWQKKLQPNKNDPDHNPITTSDGSTGSKARK